jgi:hypothetical protein
MPNAISKITAALLSVVLLFLVPAVHTAQREEDLQGLSTYNTVIQFVDAARNKGYVSSTMYLDFTQQIEQFGDVYDIELEHAHKTYHPEYSDVADAISFQNKYSIYYNTYYTATILEKLFPESEIDQKGYEASTQYPLQVGDYFNVKVRRKSISFFHILNQLIVGSMYSGQASVEYGGMILNEDN